MSAGYENAIRKNVPDAQVCFDPFHVIQLGGRAVDKVSAASGTPTGAPAARTASGSRPPAGRCSKTPPSRPSASSPRSPRSCRPTSACFARCCCSTSCAGSTASPARKPPNRLDAWLAWASRSKLKPFVALARTIRKHKPGVLAAIELGLSNGRLEGLNSKVRLLSHRAYGFASADALIATIYLCCAGITIPLPHR